MESVTNSNLMCAMWEIPKSMPKAKIAAPAISTPPKALHIMWYSPVTMPIAKQISHRVRLMRRTSFSVSSILDWEHGQRLLISMRLVRSGWEQDVCTIPQQGLDSLPHRNRGTHTAPEETVRMSKVSQFDGSESRTVHPRLHAYCTHMVFYGYFRAVMTCWAKKRWCGGVTALSFCRKRANTAGFI